jgi:hypothetical protein
MIYKIDCNVRTFTKNVEKKVAVNLCHMIVNMCMKQYCPHGMGKGQFQTWISHQNTWPVFFIL